LTSNNIKREVSNNIVKRRLLYILFLALAVPIGAIEVPCGTWIELRATAVEDWHFVHWNDGDTSAVRQVEVLGNAHYTAYYAPNCKDPVLPVVALYDWLVMLDIKTINAAGYYFGENNVSWYRVKGAPDTFKDDATGDDEPMGTGFYLTIDQSFLGTGDYYAAVDMSADPSGELCGSVLRSEIVHYVSTTPAAVPPVLEPTVVRPNESQRILRLNPHAPTTVTVYDIAGHRLQTLSADGVERMSLQAEGGAGCYQVVVQNGDQRTVLRYIVVK
jgi:hypothetical protein